MNKPITKRLVDSLPTVKGKREKVYDTKLTGFGVVVYESGKKSFFVEYGPKENRRRFTLGRYGAHTVEQARDKAQEALAQIVSGGDPLTDREERRAMPTFETFADEYLGRVRLRKKQPRHDERYLSDAKVRWGSRPLDEVTRRDVQRAMTELAEKGSTTANRWLASVRACFSEAVRQDMIEANPAVGIALFREAPPRQRTLTDEELTAALAAIDRLETFERSALLLLVETGARKSEVLRARWADVDLDKATWTLPSPKAGRPQAIPLTEDTVELLRSIPRVGPYIIPGRRLDQPRADLKDSWEQVRAEAGLTDVTIHDLRRTFGLAAARKVGIFAASKLLRHSSVRVTEQVYAPVTVEDFRTDAETLRESRSKVLPMRRKVG